MRELPRDVVHFNFQPPSIPLNPTRIWTAARSHKRVHLEAQLTEKFGELAIHLATRFGLMAATVQELKAALLQIYQLADAPWGGREGVTQVLRGEESDRVRDRVLLNIDTFLFEFRAYLELLARFSYGVLAAIKEQPPDTVTLQLNRKVKVMGKDGRLRTHNHLLYLCDTLGITPGWYEFLSEQRNLFAHEATPYLCLELLRFRPPEIDLIVMKTNIQDFTSADRSDFFRVSELQQIVRGVTALSEAVQDYLVDKVAGK